MTDPGRARAPEEGSGAGTESPSLARLRGLLLWVVALGILGLGGELVLLEHWESPLQLVPFAAMAISLPVVVSASVRPSRARIRLLRALMGVFVLAGVLGLVLHWRGNVLLQLEMDPELGGWPFVRQTVFGGNPVLAPGALLHMGLVGLLATFRHPTTLEGC